MKTTLTLIALGIACMSQAQVVYANSFTGDVITTPSSSPINVPITSYTGPGGEKWIYRNTKNSAVVGIDGVYPRSGNGSAHFQSPLAPGASSTWGQSEIAMSTTFSTNGDSQGNLGLLDNLTNWGADVLTTFCNAGPGTNIIQTPVLRLEVFSPTAINSSGSAGVYGQIVWDNYTGYNNDGLWHTANLFGNASTTQVRATSQLGNTYLGGNFNYVTLQSLLGTLNGKNFTIIGINGGVGSWSSAFDGAIDNYHFGVLNGNNTYNFELAPVPEPMSMFALGAGALALIRRKRSTK